jgi:hypothetical protein
VGGIEMMKEMTQEEIVELVQSYNPQRLLEVYSYLLTHWNPIDYTACDLYEECKKEILRRLVRGDD